jgi:hypothetical protein
MLLELIECVKSMISTKPKSTIFLKCDGQVEKPRLVERLQKNPWI